MGGPPPLGTRANQLPAGSLDDVKVGLMIPENNGEGTVQSTHVAELSSATSNMRPWLLCRIDLMSILVNSIQVSTKAAGEE